MARAVLRRGMILPEDGRPASAQNAGEAGYSLMELLIVMAILAVLIGIAAPALLRQLESRRERAALDDIEASFLALPGAARTAGADLVVLAPAGGDDVRNPQAPPRAPFILPLAPAQFYRLPAPPEGWTIAIEQPIWVRYDGVCEGGRVVVTPRRGPAVTYRLARYSCAPERLTETDIGAAS